MIKTSAQQEFRVAIDSFIAASRKNYDGYAYATGYLSSTVIEMLDSLTKKQQKSMIQNLQAAALHQQQSIGK